MADESDTKLTFDHQCFLLDYAPDILAPANAKCPYENFHSLGMGANESVHDAIMGFSAKGILKRLIRLRPEEQGLLQPTVRLWRVFPAKATSTGEDIEDEFIFDSALNPNTIEGMLNSTYGRAGGNGIKSFEWEFGGTNPAEAEAVIQVKMTLQFQSIADLRRGWGEGGSPPDCSPTNNGTTGFQVAQGGTVGGCTPSFMELILLPPGSKLGPDEYDPAFYKIKAQVGWALPPTLEDQELARELRQCQLVMYLNLITHEIKIKEDGSIEVDVEYVGSTEMALEAGVADVIFPVGSSKDAWVNDAAWWNPFSYDDERTVQDVDAEIAALEEQLELNEDQQECAGGSDNELNEERADMLEELGDLKDDKKKVDSNNRTQAYETFTKNMSKFIRHLDIENGFLKDWEKNVNNERIPLQADISIGDQGWFSNPAKEAESADPTDTSDDDIYYVYLGDIIEQACMSFSPSALEEPSNPCRNMKFVTGPLQYINPRTRIESIKAGEPPVIETINLADVPISYTMFLKFWNDNVVEPERDSYPVRAFIKDVIQKLVAPVFTGGCFPNAPNQIPTVSTAVFTVSSGRSPRDLIAEIPGARPNMFKVRDHILSNGSIAPGDDPGWTYVFLYMNTAAIGVGDQREDEERGIYHYQIGEDRGLLKKLDFKKNDVQGMKEARQDESGAISQIREMYNADVTMLGNNIYIPGMTVFLWPPPGLGNPAKCDTDANLLGLGGYYNVIKVRSTIKRGGQYDTKLECVFAGATRENCNPEGSSCGETASGTSAETAAWYSDWDFSLSDAWDSLGIGDRDVITSEDIADEGCEGKESGGFSSWFGW